MKTESETLKRLGAIPFWRGRTKCFDNFRELYAHTMELAKTQLAKEECAAVKASDTDPKKRP